MSLPCLCAAYTIVRSIILAMKQSGGQKPVSIRPSPLAHYGWKHIPCRQLKAASKVRPSVRNDSDLRNARPRPSCRPGTTDATKPIDKAANTQ
jgi:hypothetical protein